MKRAPLIWLTGYGGQLRKEVRLGAVDRARLSLVGAGVVVSCLAASINAALASTWLTSGQAFWMVATCAAVAGLAGIIFVLVYDRALIFSGDQGGPRGGRSWLKTIRIVLILCLAASTLLKVSPTFFHQELNQVAQEMQDSRDAGRTNDLARQFRTTTLLADENAARQQVAVSLRALNQVPGEIASALAAAESCWASVERARRALIASGAGRGEARRRLGGQYTRCAAQRRDAAVALEQYRAGVRADLNDARDRSLELRRDRQNAQRQVGVRLTAGRASDGLFVTAGSLEVLAEAASRNKLLLLQLFALYLVIAFADGAGLLLKSAIGRTEAGVKLGNDREIAFADAEARRTIGVRQAALRVDVDEAFITSMREAVRSPEARAQLQQVNERFAVTLAAPAAAAMAAAELEELAEKMDRIARRRPGLADLVANLMDEAVAQAARDFGAACA